MSPRRLARPLTARDHDIRRRFYREAVERRANPQPPADPPPMCTSTLQGAPCIHIAGPFHGDKHHDIADREWNDSQADAAL
jgi:hypothetical protein